MLFKNKSFYASFLLIIIFGLTIPVPGNGQLLYKYSYPQFRDSLKIDKPDFRNIEMQIRIWTCDWEAGKHKLNLLEKNKNGNWIGIAINFNCYSNEDCDILYTKHADSLDLTGWEEIWSKILKSGYLNIRDEKKIRKDFVERYKSYKADSIETDDFGKPLLPVIIMNGGECYQIEILKHYHKKRISYCNPESYYNFYRDNGVDMYEYKQMIDLNKLLSTVLNICI